jgi:nuclear migration protein JNM1
MAPVLTRLSAQLPQIPHLLARLRTLSALHSSAAIFDETLTSLEGEQQQVRKTLEELNGAVDVVEERLQENEKVVKGNISDLERRVEDIIERLKKLEDV